MAKWEGAGGFHVVTIVTDGYGHLIAEDDKGTEIAKAAIRDSDSSAQQQSAFLALMQQVWLKMNEGA